MTRPPPTCRMAAPLALAVTLSLLPEVGGGPTPLLTPEAHRALAAAAFEVIVDGHQEGSGFVVDGTGLGLTAEHLMGRPGRRVEVVSPEWGRLPAEVVAVDAGHDLALLRLPARPRGEPYPALALADAPPPAGRPVAYYGSAIYRHGLLLPGTVASARPTFEWIGEHRRYVGVIHVAAMTPKGTSGGPWVDAAGAVVGLQSGMMIDSGSLVGVAFVVPASALRALLAARSHAHSPTLGASVEELWERPAEFVRRFPDGAEGAVLTAVVGGGPAGRAGLVVDELITAVEGRPIRYRHQLLSAVRAKRPGEAVALTVLRPGGEREGRPVSVVLGRLEAAWAGGGR